MRIRPSSDTDIEAITAIYAQYVQSSVASFEIDPPDPAEMLARRRAIVAIGLPYLVAEVDGVVAGYAYAAMYRPRAAYRFTVEDSIYLDPEYSRRGIGRQLLAAVIERCEEAGYRQMVAVIGGSDNAASIGLHRALGFGHVGVLRSAGFKFGKWVDSVLMQRELSIRGE